MAYLRLHITLLLGGVALFAFLEGANGTATCLDASSPCVIDMGNSSYDNSVPFVTAVGCRKEVHVTFGSLISDVASPNVELYTTTNIKKNSKDLNPFQTACCIEAPLDREKSCVIDRAMETKAFDLFECISLDTTEKWPGYTKAKVTFLVPYDSDMNNDGQLQFCLWASHNLGGQTNPLRSAKYCITIQVQRCSACLKDGEGLTNMAKQWGTHWTQIYSANEDIVGTPDHLETGRLLRLGPLYELREGDTLLSVALKFGVSVNQLFFWNKYLRPLEDTVSENENLYSREVAVGHQLCVLPKTCYNSFANQQPVFNQMEVGLKPSQGGGWADPPQVLPAQV